MFDTVLNTLPVFSGMQTALSRSSRSQMFFKKFANFKGKHLCWSFFLIKLQAFRLPATLLKRDSSADVVLWNLQRFSEHFSLQNTYGSCFWPSGFNLLSLYYSILSNFKVHYPPALGFLPQWFVSLQIMPSIT